MQAFFLLLSSNIAYADVRTVMMKINNLIINPIIMLMFAVAILILVIGFVEFLAKPDDEEAREKGKRHMLWGVLGMFIMVAVFGIMHFLVNTFGFVAPGGGAINLQSN